MNPLDQLADIHLPAPLGFWPLAWGWWLLIALALSVVVMGIVWAIRARKKNAYRRQALSELKQIQIDYAQSPQAYVQAANQLLHRCVMHYQAQNNFSLTGEAWLNWLAEQCPQTRVGFSEGIGRVLVNGPYEANFNLSDFEQRNLHALIQLWIEKHQFANKRLGGNSNV